jgi:putative ABC transport system permease protein
VAIIEDPGQLGALLGPLVPVDAAIAALRRGEAVVTVAGILDGTGRAWVRPEPIVVDSSGSWNQQIRPPVAIAAVEASGGTTPAAVLVGPAAFAPGGALAAVGKPQTLVSLLVVSPSAADRPDRPTVVDQLSTAFAKARVPVQVMRWDNAGFDTQDAVGLVLAAASVGTLLMALLAGLMVTALAMADARADLVTLAAVGAAPGVRRRMAAASAGTVAALGCAAGVVSGLVVAKLLVGLFYATGGRAFEIRWWLVGFVLVAIPILTAGVAWLTTRSRVLIPRRTDS